ncbi:DNA-directed RNA polymerase subunit beta [Nocardia cyriacigeorgica]|uniref:DNA-directed RNA polymerase subunit beta n=1 Tax=Nocardia cyriacigeorgica TaxID=135487 RepID=A0A5R8PBN9_9NOCA|nr:DNA-directed RNA polymerase subunit beta [Nocardia cyriacigeorgica]TLG05828.1 DNA-directed RNA polymerase subunit beta [Nocardia cyriacigeorgica]
MSAPVEADALGRCHYYRTVCGLPCHIDESGMIAVSIGGGVRAVTTPEPLAKAMREFLVARSLVGPIVWHRSRRCTFLTGYSVEADDDSLYAPTLLRTNSQIVPPLGMVPLPSPGDDGTYRRWIEPARDGFRPSLGTVLDALLECAR